MTVGLPVGGGEFSFQAIERSDSLRPDPNYFLGLSGILSGGAGVIGVGTFNMGESQNDITGDIDGFDISGDVGIGYSLRNTAYKPPFELLDCCE